MTVVAGESVDVQLSVNSEVVLESIALKEVTDGVPRGRFNNLFILHIEFIVTKYFVLFSTS